MTEIQARKKSFTQPLERNLTVLFFQMQHPDQVMDLKSLLGEVQTLKGDENEKKSGSDNVINEIRR